MKSDSGDEGKLGKNSVKSHCDSSMRRKDLPPPPPSHRKTKDVRRKFRFKGDPIRSPRIRFLFTVPSFTEFYRVLPSFPLGRASYRVVLWSAGWAKASIESYGSLKGFVPSFTEFFFVSPKLL